jgi:hypothetical protein
MFEDQLDKKKTIERTIQTLCKMSDFSIFFENLPHNLNELDVRKPLVIFISQRSEELRLYKRVYILTISNPSLKAVFSNASPG